MAFESWRRICAHVIGERPANRFGIVARLSHHNHGIRYTHSAHGAVFFDCLVKQSERLGSLHGNHGIFPDADLRVKNEPGLLIRADDLAPEIPDAYESIILLAGRQIHAVNGNNPPWLHDAELLFDQEQVLPPELVRVLAVSHVAVTVAVSVERLKRRAEH